MSTKHTTEELVEMVKDHALAHYTEGGWDVIVECWSDAEIAKELGRTQTWVGALRKFNQIASIYSEKQADARNSAF